MFYVLFIICKARVRIITSPNIVRHRWVDTVHWLCTPCELTLGCLMIQMDVHRHYISSKTASDKCVLAHFPYHSGSAGKSPSRPQLTLRINLGQVRCWTVSSCHNFRFMARCQPPNNSIHEGHVLSILITYILNSYSILRSIKWATISGA